MNGGTGGPDSSNTRVASLSVWEPPGLGKQVSRKKVARLMREKGLNARGRKKFIPTINWNHELPICENVLNRELDTERAGEK